MSTDLWNILANFGPNGVFVAYLVWRETITSKEKIATEKATAEANKSLATSLGALTAVIQRFDR